jgi:hypothetical protein
MLLRKFSKVGGPEKGGKQAYICLCMKISTRLLKKSNRALSQRVRYLKKKSTKLATYANLLSAKSHLISHPDQKIAGPTNEAPKGWLGAILGVEPSGNDRSGK